MGIHMSQKSSKEWLACGQNNQKIGKKIPPNNVPPGHVAVTLGEAGRRFVIRAGYLNHPILRQLLDQAYEDYGQQKDGPLTIPCNEFRHQDIIHSLRSETSTLHLSSPCGRKKKLGRVIQDKVCVLGRKRHAYKQQPWSYSC
ncbi:hypothetical protein RJ640_003164 [Escallonia rubra]|uniref:Small auxin up regulated protein n=1 Tax=Escallonia rubra TaxID=112253 RepID=A0AA88RKE1_9ASTE|nr:hypothetical protein RJ640_003164 [Escallonia rubra]